MQLSRGIDRQLPGSYHANVAPFIWLVHIVNCQHTTPHSYWNGILGADRPSIIPDSLYRRALPPTVQPNNSRTKWWCVYWTLEIDWAQRNYRYTLRSFIKLQDDSYRISDLHTHMQLSCCCVPTYTRVHVYYMHITATLNTLHECS